MITSKCVLTFGALVGILREKADGQITIVDTTHGADQRLFLQLFIIGDLVF